MSLDKAQLITDLTTIFVDLDAANTAASKASEVGTAIDDYVTSDWDAYFPIAKVVCNNDQVVCHNDEIVLTC